MAMYGTKSYELVKELERTKDSNLPPFDENGVRQILDEMQALYDQNIREGLNITRTDGGDEHWNPGISLRHAAMERNKQCVLAYLYNRLMRIRDMRWTHGSVLPDAVRLNTTEQEQQFFKNYNKLIANYMRAYGEGEGIGGLDLTIDIKPPKSLMTRVRILQDWEIEDEDSGELVVLKKQSLHFLPAYQAEPLIRQGVLERVETV